MPFLFGFATRVFESVVHAMLNRSRQTIEMRGYREIWTRTKGARTVTIEFNLTTDAPLAPNVLRKLRKLTGGTAKATSQEKEGSLSHDVQCIVKNAPEHLVAPNNDPRIFIAFLLAQCDKLAPELIAEHTKHPEYTIWKLLDGFIVSVEEPVISEVVLEWRVGEKKMVAHWVFDYGDFQGALGLHLRNEFSRHEFILEDSFVLEHFFRVIMPATIKHKDMDPLRYMRIWESMSRNCSELLRQSEFTGEWAPYTMTRKITHIHVTPDAIVFHAVFRHNAERTKELAKIVVITSNGTVDIWLRGKTKTHMVDAANRQMMTDISRQIREYEKKLKALTGIWHLYTQQVATHLLSE
ncbi:hypothetical protein HOI18_04740 [Candidatus Uhrbacteria bacterium]|jgi:hypothetical protein|nr:hypothetical protein [Candidatus Uhrbacteria bacterium]